MVILFRGLLTSQNRKLYYDPCFSFYPCNYLYNSLYNVDGYGLWFLLLEFWDGRIIMVEIVVDENDWKVGCIVPIIIFLAFLIVVWMIVNAL